MVEMTCVNEYVGINGYTDVGNNITEQTITNPLLQTDENNLMLSRYEFFFF